MRAAYLLSPTFITRGRMGASKAALILMKYSHFDWTLQYLSTEISNSFFVLINFVRFLSFSGGYHFLPPSFAFNCLIFLNVVIVSLLYRLEFTTIGGRYRPYQSIGHTSLSHSLMRHAWGTKWCQLRTDLRQNSVTCRSMK